MANIDLIALSYGENTAFDFQWKIQAVRIWGIPVKTADTTHYRTTTIVRQITVSATYDIVTIVYFEQKNIVDGENIYGSAIVV